MLLKITTTHQPATDLGYLLGKHPERFQTKELSFGKVHVFYPEVSEEKCTAALLMDINAIALSRNRKKQYSSSFKLGHYVNDRPYVASSFLTTAISKVYGGALNGTCKDRPVLVGQAIPLTAELSVVHAKGGLPIIQRFFEPLGYEITAENYPLDEQFSEWGDSNYFKLKLTNTISLQALLTHLFVLIPALDNNKHYYVGKAEVEKLLAKGGDWLKQHPEYELITRRYLKHRKGFAKAAIAQLVGNENMEAEKEGNQETKLEKKLSLHQIRLAAVTEQLKASGAKTVVDLGCGSGKLLKLLLQEKQFEKIVGMDVSYQALEVAKRRLYLENMAPRMRARIDLIQGALNYKDNRIANFDAAALVEVIEHLDTNRLVAFEKVVFGNAQPKTVIITTPNVEYNVLFEGLPAGKFRHSDHRFEWTRKEFETWGNRVGALYNYQVNYLPLGPEDETVGAPSQMAIFSKSW
ncbi:MAG: 3' terminal RNA ribose 2'-O-methyltransferase Hen1 [Saprospiraceae bacterium]